MRERRRAQPGDLLGRESALRADQDRPGARRRPDLQRRQRGGGGRAVAAFVAEHQPPRAVPAVERRAQRLRVAYLRHGEDAALLRRLDAVRAQPVNVHPLGVGEAGDHRAQAARAHLGGLLGDEVGARLLERREQQVEVGAGVLRAQPPGAAQRAAAPPGLRHHAAPLAVAPVEQRHVGALAQPHDGEQVMRLIARRRNLGARAQIGRDVEPDFRRRLRHDWPP